MRQSSDDFEYIQRVINPIFCLDRRDSEFPFRVLSELVDNASDAGARKLKIYNVFKENYGNLLHFEDDGEGMEPLELLSAVSIGCSTRRETKAAIGKFGHGLKAPLCMYRNVLIVTKKNNCTTVALMRDFDGTVINIGVVSYEKVDGQFHEKLNLTEGEYLAIKHHESNLNFILRYSPLKSKEMLLHQFSSIIENGTKVILFGCKLNEKQCLEYHEGIADILIQDPYTELEYVLDTPRPIMADEYVSTRSFRKYLSLLYKQPRILIYISDSKVETMILETKLCHGKSYTHRTKLFSNQLKEIIISTIEEHAQDVKALNESTKMFNELNDYYDLDNADSVARVNYILANIVRLKYKMHREVNTINGMSKEVNSEQSVVIKFGLNLYDPDKNASVVYCNGRMVKIIPALALTEHLLGEYEYKGIVAIIEMPFSVRDKKLFAESVELSQLESIVSHYRDIFSRETRGDLAKASYREFWEYYGFGETRKESHETYDARCKQKMTRVVQCLKCLCWRALKDEEEDAYSGYSENQASCDHHEQLVHFGRGKQMIPEVFDIEEGVIANELIEEFQQRTMRSSALVSKTGSGLSSIHTKRKGTPRKRPESSTRFTYRGDSEQIKQYSSHGFMNRSNITLNESNAEHVLVERLRFLLNKVSGSGQPFNNFDKFDLVHFNFEKYILDKICLVDYSRDRKASVDRDRLDEEEKSTQIPEEEKVLSFSPEKEGNISKVPSKSVVLSHAPVTRRQTTRSISKGQSTSLAKPLLKKYTTQMNLPSATASNVSLEETYSDDLINILLPTDEEVEIRTLSEAESERYTEQTSRNNLQHSQPQQPIRINITEALGRAQPHPLFESQWPSSETTNFPIRRTFGFFNPFQRDGGWSSLKQGVVYRDLYTNIEVKKDPGVPKPDSTLLNPIVINSRSNSPTMTTTTIDESKKRSSTTKSRSPNYNYRGDYLIPIVNLTELTDEELDLALKKKTKTSARQPPKLINPHELRAQIQEQNKREISTRQYSRPPALQPYTVFREATARTSKDEYTEAYDDVRETRRRRSKETSDEEFDPKKEISGWSRGRRGKK